MGADPHLTRFDVAMTGRLGFELRPERVPQGDLDFSKAAIEVYKKIRAIVQFGDLYRLRSPEKGDEAALMYLYGDEAVVFAFTLGRDLMSPTAPLKLRGLDPNSEYRVTELNSDANEAQLNPHHGQVLSGEFLMQSGLHLAWPQGDYQSRVLHLSCLQS